MRRKGKVRPRGHTADGWHEFVRVLVNPRVQRHDNVVNWGKGKKHTTTCVGERREENREKSHHTIKRLDYWEVVIGVRFFFVFVGWRWRRGFSHWEERKQT
jgi:hypothetical protein